MALKKTIFILVFFVLGYITIKFAGNYADSNRQNADPAPKEEHQLNKIYGGVPVWIYLDDVRPAPVGDSRTTIALLQAGSFSETNLRNIFTDMSEANPTPPVWYIEAYSEREIVEKAIERYQNPPPPDLFKPTFSKSDQIEDAELSSKPGFYYASFIRAFGEEWFSYRPDANKVDVIRVQLKVKEIAYSGDLNFDLVLAAKVDDSAKVKQMLAEGADVNAKDNSGSTALMYAVKKGRHELAMSLLSKGADVNAKNLEGWTALIYAASPPCGIGIFRELLARGADVNAKNHKGHTALISVASGKDPDKLRLLLSNGADVNAQDKYGYTPLMWAVDNRDIESVSALIQAGANLNVMNNEGETALKLAQKHDSQYIVQLLKKAGAKK